MVTNSQPNNPPGQPSSQRVQAAFDAFDKALLLDADERNEAQNFHLELTKHLKEKGLTKDAFLQGSFARKTMLKPLRDVDKVEILHDNYLELMKVPGGAERAADLVENALRELHPDATYERTRHSIKLDLGEDTFSFDVVPAFEVEDGSGDVWIMDRENDSWKKSNTRELMKVVAARNAECGGAFIHQIRFVKQWVRTVLGERIPGLHIESISYECVDEKFGHAEAVARIIECGARLLDPHNDYSDPTGEDELSKKLSDTDREVARQAFVAASFKTSEAMALDAAGRQDAAIAVWVSIFGDAFSETKPTGGQYLKGLASGAPVATGIPTHHQGTTPTRAWAPW
jgi:hypothetical protein